MAAPEIAQIMANVGCKQAERLLWKYLEALGESNRAQLDYIEAIRSGSTRSIRAKAKASKGTASRIGEARQAFEKHASEHACCLRPGETRHYSWRET